MGGYDGGESYGEGKDVGRNYVNLFGTVHLKRGIFGRRKHNSFLERRETRG